MHERSPEPQTMHADPVVVVLDTVQQVVRELHPQDERTVFPTLDNTLERDPGLDSRGRGPVLDSIQRECFMRTGQAVPTTPDDLHALRFVACGQPLPGHQIRIVDAAGFEVVERQEGRVGFCGPSATSGYFHNPEETRHLFHGTWLDAGNLAYMASGEVYVTGRTKDLIIRAGRNIYPQELEEVIEEIPRIRKGCVAVFGSPDSVARTESDWSSWPKPMRQTVRAWRKPQGTDWTAAVTLRDAARAEIVRHCGEPDMAPTSATDLCT